MNVYKPKYKDKNGKTKLHSRYRCDFIDCKEIRRRLPAFSNKKESEKAGEMIQWLMSSTGRTLDPDLQRWLEQIPKAMRNRLAAFGLLTDAQGAAGEPLSKHVDDFGQYLRDKGNTEAYAEVQTARVQIAFDACGFKLWSDISASALQRQLADLRDKADGISAQTYNYYLQACKSFCRWMIRDRRAASSPLEHLEPMRVLSTQRKVNRRPATADEMRRLLEAAGAAEMRYGMQGYERAALYRFAAETGLRAGEIRSLRASSFDFDNNTVSVVDAYSKNRKPSTIDLKPDTAAIMQEFLRGKLPTAEAFHLPKRWYMAPMLKKDLEDAGIPYIDEDGRKLDFHSLRHTTASFLADAGVDPKVAQEIMRHSDINMTLSRYSHVYRGRTSEAVAKLPDLSKPSEQKQKQTATGTDGKSDVPNMCLNSAQHKTPVDNRGHTNRTDDTDTPFSTTPAAIQTRGQGITNPAKKAIFSVTAPREPCHSREVRV